MATKTTYSVTLDNGKTATRKSARTYTHAVVDNSGVYSFHGGADLAARALQKYRGWGFGTITQTDGPLRVVSATKEG